MVEGKYYLNLIKENLFLITMIRYDFETRISLQSDTLYHLSETLKIIVLCLRDRSEFL